MISQFVQQLNSTPAENGSARLPQCHIDAGGWVGGIREPHGSHVVWDIPQVSQRVPADRIRRVPAGYPVWVPHGVPQGTRLGPVWVCWLGRLQRL